MRPPSARSRSSAAGRRRRSRRRSRSTRRRRSASRAGSGRPEPRRRSPAPARRGGRERRRQVAAGWCSRSLAELDRGDDRRSGPAGRERVPRAPASAVARPPRSGPARRRSARRSTARPSPARGGRSHGRPTPVAAEVRPAAGDHQVGARRDRRAARPGRGAAAPAVAVAIVEAVERLVAGALRGRTARARPARSPGWRRRPGPAVARSRRSRWASRRAERADVLVVVADDVGERAAGPPRRNAEVAAGDLPAVDVAVRGASRAGRASAVRSRASVHPVAEQPADDRQQVQVAGVDRRRATGPAGSGPRAAASRSRGRCR